MDQDQQNYIPKIDISSLLSNNFDSPECQKIIRDIDYACRNIGFFTVINHGVSKELIQKMVNKAKQFFYLPQQKKLQSAAKKWNPSSINSYRGYFPSTVNGKQGLDIQDPKMKSIPEKLNNNPYYEFNIFPKNLSEDWLTTVQQYYTELHKLTIILIKALFFAYGKAQKWDKFAQGLQRPYNLTTLRFNYYPKHEKNSVPVQISKQDGAQLACETHVDSVIFTVLYQDSQGGLQVKNQRDGKWHTVLFDQNAFVVNTGKSTQILTNGNYPATWHRVLMNYHERISIPFFFEPPADLILDSNILVQSQSKYKKESYGQFLNQSLKKFKQYVRDQEQVKDKS